MSSASWTAPGRNILQALWTHLDGLWTRKQETQQPQGFSAGRQLDAPGRTPSNLNWTEEGGHIYPPPSKRPAGSGQRMPSFNEEKELT